jgi:crotonobetainyl-CoA:carnitine CoA-transferase CaiB-like acyl-CoA transferase
MKLEGVRVVDLSVFLPGPYLTLALADHGAEVIKVEQPGDGDPGRHIGLSDGEHTVFFRNLNRGKRSVALDLKSEAGRASLLDLCDSADVFVESFRPGVMQRLGFDAKTLRARNPGLIYVSISAFGQDSAYRERPAHDLAVEAMAGVLSQGLGADGQPAIPGIPVADVLAALHGLAGVLMALYRREQTGTGDQLDISMRDSMVGASLNILGSTLAENRQPVASHERTTGGSAFYRLYATADGGHIALAGQEAKFVHSLLGALGHPELAEIVLRGPGPHQAPVARFLEQAFAQHTRAEWEERLISLDVCWGPVLSLPEAIGDPDLAARGMVLHDAQGRRHVGSPIHFEDEPAQLTFDAPELDEFRPLAVSRRSAA